MSFRIEQRIGKHIYVYEVESYWDKEKQSPRQKRRYLGKKDPRTGEVLKVRGSFKPRYARDWGNVYLLEHLARKIGLEGVLGEVYPDLCRELLYLAIYEVSEGEALYLFKGWSEGTSVEGVEGLSSQRLSELVRRLGKRGIEREHFFGKWIAAQEDIRSIVFDITSFSSYSEGLGLLEWGYNRDGESLPQINWGLVMGEPSLLPLFYTIYPGSIKDVSTLKNVVGLAEGYGLRETMFVLDRGFYSQGNLEGMHKEGIQFLIPLPFSTRLSRRLVARQREALCLSRNSFLLEKKVLFHVRDYARVGGVKVVAHVYLDERRRAEERERVLERIMELEGRVKEREFEREEDLEGYLEGTIKGSSRYFKISKKGGQLRVKRRDEELEKMMERMGKTILLSNKLELGREEALRLYRGKDYVEGMFDVVKNELRDNRLRIHSEEAMEGRLFLTFLGVILHSALSRSMREQGLFNKYTVNELLSELKKIRMVEMENGKKFLTEVSKKQREILQKFSLPLPNLT